MGSHFSEWDGADAKAAMNTQTGVVGGYTAPQLMLTADADGRMDFPRSTPRALAVASRPSVAARRFAVLGFLPTDCRVAARAYNSRSPASHSPEVLI